MRVKPTRKPKENTNGFYKLETGCGRLKITIHDGEDGYPVRVVVEPTGGGCQGGIEYLRRSITYCLECNLDIENLLSEVMDKIVCPSAKSRKLKEPEKEVHLSCAKAVAFSLRSHLSQKK